MRLMKYFFSILYQISLYNDVTAGISFCDLCDVGQNLPTPGWNRVIVSENFGGWTGCPIISGS